jgi:hypothetical protein
MLNTLYLCSHMSHGSLDTNDIWNGNVHNITRFTTLNIKRYSFKTLNKYNAYINYMHFTAGNIPSCTHASTPSIGDIIIVKCRHKFGVLKSVITTREVRAEHIIFMQSYESRFAGSQNKWYMEWKCTQYYKIHNTEHKTIFIQNTEQI